MASTELVSTEEELLELYEWFLIQAQEQEADGYEDRARKYREFAQTVRQEVTGF